MVVDTVIRHWDTVVAGKATGPEGSGRAVQTLSSLFYVDDRILDSPHLSRIQAALDVLMGLFDHVGLQKTFGKTMGTTCQPCRTPGSLSEVVQYAYDLGQLEGLCIILIKTNNGLREVDGCVPVHQSRMTVRRYSAPSLKCLHTYRRGLHNKRQVISAPHKRGCTSGYVSYLGNLSTVKIMYIPRRMYNSLLEL